MKWTQARTLAQFQRFVLRRFLQHEGLENAKSLTYTSLFAVVPLATLVFAILSAFPAFQVFAIQIQDMLFQRLLPSSSNEVADYLSGFSEQARNLTWAGAVLLLVTSFLMLRNIERSFNQIWGVGQLRKGVASFLLYWSVLSLGPLLLGLGFAISSYVTSLSLFERLSTFSGLPASSLLLEIFPTLLTIGAFTLLYVAVPNCKVPLAHGLVGAVVVAVLFKLVKWVFVSFIARTSYELVYGTFAALPIFLVWLYLCWVVILLGANLVRSIPLFRSDQIGARVHPSLLLLALLHLLWEKQQAGEALQLQQLQIEQWPFRSISVEQLLTLLEEQHLVRALNHDEYMLARDLEQLSLWDVLSRLPWPQPDQQALNEVLPAVIARHLPDSAALKSHFQRLMEVSASEFSTSIGAWFRQGS